MYTLTFCVILLILLYYMCNSTYDYWKKKNVPFVHPMTLFGNFFHLTMGKVNVSSAYLKLYREGFGKKYIGIYFMRTPMLLLRDPELINRVLIKDFSHFINHGAPCDVVSTPLSNHLYNMKSQQWKIMRDKISPAFTPFKLKNLLEPTKECCEELLINIKKNLNNSNIINIEKLLENLSMDVIGVCGFGLKLSEITYDDSPFHKAGRLLLKPSLLTQMKFLTFFISPKLRKVINVTDFPSDALEFMEKAFRHTMDYREKNNIFRGDIVDYLLQAKKDLVIDKSESPVIFEEIHIIANAFFFFVAGFETTAITMEFCLYQLALNKNIQDHVRKEVFQAKAKHNGTLNYEFLGELHYLEMVICETLRMYTPLDIMREVEKPYQIPDEDFVIEKNTKIMISPYCIHMDPKYYPNPMKFDPERFSPEEKAKRPNSTFLPFGDGPRNCLGEIFSKIEIKLAISLILMRYELLPCEKTLIPMQFENRSLIMRPKNGMWLKFQPIE
ncbi:cytochrome P450 6k1-like [Daktulosphaira vitifoliae]|uniref:cytochrome P450 6k1-like n=1 Tax=Daktulosphaira vitifoliae TaxID=58002 RepID=UPI0021AABD25|nr:cytochrome P450 6k1-like [Daktulosphaira vitifoliae]